MSQSMVHRIAGVALGGVLLAAAVAGCAGQTGDVGTGSSGGSLPSGSTVPTVPASAQQPGPSSTSQPGAINIPGRDQAFLLNAVDRGTEEPVLTVTASGRIGTYPGGADTGDREQFTLGLRSSAGDTYILKTAKLRVGGEPQCVGVSGDILQTMACDASASVQIVKIVPAGGGTFELVIGGYNVEVDQLGKVSLKQRGNTPAQTKFRFIPSGK